jgi:hypothetical protein
MDLQLSPETEERAALDAKKVIGAIFYQPLCFTADTPTSSDTGKQRLVRERPKKRGRPEVPVSRQRQLWCRRQAQ